ncbi:MAG: LemA family protein, partial [Myxococcaceae bacterium]
MKPIVAVLLGVVGLVVVVGLWFASTSNRLVGLNEQVRQTWSQVENNYQRRSDLIPNLVETVKGSANFEKQTYVAVAEARNKAAQINVGRDVLSDPKEFARFEQAQRELSTSLGRLIATAEAYPDLKSNASFRD